MNCPEVARLTQWARKTSIAFHSPERQPFPVAPHRVSFQAPTRLGDPLGEPRSASEDRPPRDLTVHGRDMICFGAAPFLTRPAEAGIAARRARATRSHATTAGSAAEERRAVGEPWLGLQRSQVVFPIFAHGETLSMRVSSISPVSRRSFGAQKLRWTKPMGRKPFAQGPMVTR